MRTSLKFNPQSTFTAAFVGELMETERKNPARPHTTADMSRLWEKSCLLMSGFIPRHEEINHAALPHSFVQRLRHTPISR